MPEKAGLTYADLASFPDDGLRRELLDGELLVSPSPNLRHQRIVGRFYFSLENHVRRHGGGEVFVAPADVVLSDRTVLEPDVLFVATDRLEILTDPNVQGPPSLVVEMVSDSTTDRVRKRDLYARYGVPDYWIADPEADRVEVLRLAGARFGKPEIYEPGDVLEYAPLPGLHIEISKIFER